MQAADPASLPNNTLEILVALIFVAILSAAISLIATGLVRRVVARVEGHTSLSRPLPTAPLRVVRLAAFVVSIIGLMFPALAIVGVDMPVELGGGRLGQWAARTALRIGVIALVAVTASRLVSGIITRAQREMVTGSGPADVERRKRADTIGRTLSRLLSSVIWVAALLMILRALDVDITPVLTGAGILGLAVGFGAQTLVKDVISGFFLILEDQVRVGDVAVVNGTGGAVEQINMRTIVLRDLEGTVYVIPNGEIRTLANRSKDYSYYLLDLAIDWGRDVDQMIELVTEAAAGLQQDPAFAPHILEPMETLGVDNFGPTSVTLRFRIKTYPLSQWIVGREWRRRVKKAFDTRGLRMPPQQVEVTMKQ